jgi:MurNAc alpha-1-phosphate uridylyltransferase
MLPIAILAGGYATRLGLLASDYPKCLIKINDRPFVDWQLDLLIKNGYSDFVFCISHKAELVQNYLGNGDDRGVQIRYSLDGEMQLGTGGAIQKALPLLGEKFAVIYGDSYLPIDYSKVESEFLKSANQAIMTVYKNQNKFDTSNVEFVQGKLLNYEKNANNPNMNHIDYGLTYFRSSVFPEMSDGTVFDLASCCHKLAKSETLQGFEVFERFYEIGSIQGIAELSDYLRRGC